MTGVQTCALPICFYRCNNLLVLLIQKFGQILRVNFNGKIKRIYIIGKEKRSGQKQSLFYLFAIMDGSGTEKLVAMYCDQVTLPSTNYSTTPYRAWGETREVVTEKVYENITLSVYVDSDMKVKSYFDNWMKMIQDPHTRTMGYYRDYAKQIMINVEKVTPTNDGNTNPDEGKNVYSIKLDSIVVYNEVVTNKIGRAHV